MTKFSIDTLQDDTNQTTYLMSGEHGPDEARVYCLKKETMNRKLTELGYAITYRNNPYSLVGPTFFATKDLSSSETKAHEKQVVRNLLEEVDRELSRFEP
jgi:hypothetical protein